MARGLTVLHSQQLRIKEKMKEIAAEHKEKIMIKKSQTTYWMPSRDRGLWCHDSLSRLQLLPFQQPDPLRANRTLPTPPELLCKEILSVVKYKHELGSGWIALHQGLTKECIIYCIFVWNLIILVFHHQSWYHSSNPVKSSYQCPAQRKDRNSRSLGGEGDGRGNRL